MFGVRGVTVGMGWPQRGWRGSLAQGHWNPASLDGMGGWTWRGTDFQGVAQPPWLQPCCLRWNLGSSRHFPAPAPGQLPGVYLALSVEVFLGGFMPRGMWDLSSLTKDKTHTPSTGNMES